jgi:hypothetical protein
LWAECPRHTVIFKPRRDMKKRDVVSAAHYVARRYGVHGVLPM